jgi:hypothetical protein
MYCGGCSSIPFWRWLKRNQQFSLSVTCNDYGGAYLYSLQPNNATTCFGEYLCTWFWKGYQMYPTYIKRIDLFSMKMMYHHSSNNLYVHCYATFSYVCCHIYIDNYILRDSQVVLEVLAIVISYKTLVMSFKMCWSSL